MTSSNPDNLPFTNARLKTRIQQEALRLGFDKVGMISLEAFSKNDFFKKRAENLSKWLASGYQADMQWMVTHYEKRSDPASLMEGTKSIVCVAMNYYTPDAYDPHDPSRLKIAKYARGTDYHDALKKRLKELLAFIQQLDPEIRGRALTDSAPILEKPLAEMAGIGWLGKNGNVITPELGSFVFLGELLLSVDLAQDAVAVETSIEMPGCGSCTRCIDACPTEAILFDENHYGVVDASKCISYWTIEHKGDEIPADIKANMQGWIFGCDICQDVCPWNIKFAVPTTEPQFQPRPWNSLPRAEEIVTMDDETFRERYRKSPIKRAKRAGLKRNVLAQVPFPLEGEGSMPY
ncbi:MAG: tRNA epoxyqueuosine(34) reductase QueG [Vampirovibrionales bacterium]|nr:tRNA epoxyqueuosine(34) reductase QueG [Vampirovibrionales bacterium]